MPNFTKKAIKETFIELLDERPLNKITVKDIVEACGINRNSFYYHFEDLPALVEERRRDWDFIILDPPAFTKSRRAGAGADLRPPHHRLHRGQLRRGAGLCPGPQAGGAPHL